MQNQNEGNVFGKGVLGLDSETTKLVERKPLMGFHIPGVHKRKKSNPKTNKKNKTQQVSVPVVESTLLTGP